MEVVVDKGMQNGQKITFPGEVDEAPDTMMGDIVFLLQQKEHPKFKRKGDDRSPLWFPKPLGNLVQSNPNRNGNRGDWKRQCDDFLLTKPSGNLVDHWK